MLNYQRVNPPVIKHGWEIPEAMEVSPLVRADCLEQSSQKTREFWSRKNGGEMSFQELILVG